MSAFFGSTAIFSKYQPRPQSARSPENLLQVSPPSSERKKPPCPGTAAAAPAPRPAPGGGSGFTGGGAPRPASGTRQSTTAYTRRGLLGATAIPVRPIPSEGRPFVSCFQVVPPSIDLKMPPPGPLVGAYVYQGGRRVFQRPA